MNHSSSRFEIFATTRDELHHALKNLTTNVPPRDQGRTPKDCEQWQIQRLLEAFFLAGELHPPMRLMKRERPDFLLTTATHDMGIEATEAINPDFAKATTHPNARSPDSVVDPSLYKWGTEPRERQQIARETARTELTGDGWVGNSVELEFAAMIADIVSNKRDKLCDGYDRFECDSLLIYQNQTLPCLDIVDARDRAESKLAHLLGSRGFQRVYVDDGERILEFTTTGSRIL